MLREIWVLTFDISLVIWYRKPDEPSLLSHLLQDVSPGKNMEVPTPFPNRAGSTFWKDVATFPSCRVAKPIRAVSLNEFMTSLRL